MSRFYYTESGSPQGSDCSSTYKDIKSKNITIAGRMRKGQLEQARRLFDGMRDRTVASWNVMISGYSKWHRFSEALSLLSLMHRSNVKLNETTFSSVLSVCARQKSLGGRQIHGLVMKSGFENFEFVGSSLLYFYAGCCDIGNARKLFEELHESNELLWSLMLVSYVQCNLLNDALIVFNKMPYRGVVEWTTMISGYSKSDDGCKKAMALFQRMREGGEAAPNEFTLDSVVRACGRLGALLEGKALHALIIKLGFEFELSCSGALVDFYCNSEAIDDAKKVYETLDNPCLNISNTLIGRLITMGRIKEAEFVFSGLVERNPVSYSLLIKGYALYGRAEDANSLFLRMPARSLICMNTMIHVLSKTGEIHKALELFEEIKGDGSPVTWNSMISGYIENYQHESAIKLYIEMRRLSITHTRSTFSALLRACSCLGSLQLGQQIHSQLTKTPFEFNVYVGTALVDMYSRCGSIADAQSSFMCIAYPNVAAWTSLIYAFAHHGLDSEAILLFQQMSEQGVNPNAATFVAVLSACAGAGLVKEGMRIFHSMKQRYGLAPSLEHFTCVVDLLCRSGMLLEAEEFVKEMPFEPDEILLITMLNACWSWMDIDAGERLAQKMFALNPKPVSTCVLMSNLYAALGKWGEKIKARKLLIELEAKKDPGCSWIDLNNRVHAFCVDDRNHPCCNMIYATLRHLTASVESFAQFYYFGSDLVEATLLSLKACKCKISSLRKMEYIQYIIASLFFLNTSSWKKEKKKDTTMTSIRKLLDIKFQIQIEQ